MLFRSRSRAGIAALALLVTLSAACAPRPCPKGVEVVQVPCHTVLTHRVVGLTLSLDRAVPGWSARVDGRLIALGLTGARIPLYIGGPIVLEGPLGKTVTLGPGPASGQGGVVQDHMALPGDVPVTLIVTWSVETGVSECHGAPPTTRCGSGA